MGGGAGGRRCRPHSIHPLDAHIRPLAAVPLADTSTRRPLLLLLLLVVGVGGGGGGGGAALTANAF